MELVRSYVHENTLVEIHTDDEAQDPRKAFDQLGVMWC